MKQNRLHEGPNSDGHLPWKEEGREWVGRSRGPDIGTIVSIRAGGINRLVKEEQQEVFYQAYFLASPLRWKVPRLWHKQPRGFMKMEEAQLWVTSPCAFTCAEELLGSPLTHREQLLVTGLALCSIADGASSPAPCLIIPALSQGQAGN